jgi:DNA-binding MarR family transcriptional regulator
MTKQLKIDEILEFHNCIIEIIKKYQFRDRNEMTCHGISVSQCYVLETIYSYGELTMKDLAKRMHLAVSTITRITDQLEKKKYVVRNKNPADLREKYLKLTEKGKKIFLKSWQNVFDSEKEILQKIKPENRKELINLLKELNRSVDIWQSSCKTK